MVLGAVLGGGDLEHVCGAEQRLLGVAVGDHLLTVNIIINDVFLFIYCVGWQSIRVSSLITVGQSRLIFVFAVSSGSFERSRSEMAGWLGDWNIKC